MDRRELFRTYMARFSPTASRTALESGWCVEEHQVHLVNQATRRLEIDPRASHLIIGGIGAGKTTLLLMMQKALSTVGDITGVYIDVAEQQDLASIKPGGLIALAGLSLMTRDEKIQDERLAAMVEGFRKWALGSVTWVADPNFGMIDLPTKLGQRMVHTPGVITRPDNTSVFSAQIQAITAYARHRGTRHLVFLFDSLDRLITPAMFANSIAQDLRLLAEAGVGVVVAGSPLLQYGPGRSVLDLFTLIHTVPNVDPLRTEGAKLLEEVVRRRVQEPLFERDAMFQLVRHSGGVLRDLLALARNATEEAYVAGDEYVTFAHVLTASERFGRSLLLGVTAEDIDRLKEISRTGKLGPELDGDLALLAHRRVLEYRNGDTTYRVHPSALPFLDR